MSEKANIGLVTGKIPTGGVKLWILHERQERDVPALDADLGQWFKITNQRYEPISAAPLDTRATTNGLVEMKVPVVASHDFEAELGVKSKSDLSKVLFSPVLGKVGKFYASDSFRENMVYEVWATRMPTAHSLEFRTLSEAFGVDWMLPKQEPQLINPNRVAKYQAVLKTWEFEEGAVIKASGASRVIVSPKFGLCIARAINCPLGSSVKFLPVELDCNSTQTLAALCQPLNQKFVKIRDAVNCQFLITFTVKAAEQNTKKHNVPPFGLLYDKNSLIKNEHAGKSVTVVAAATISVNHRSVEWTIKSIEPSQVPTAPQVPTSKLADASKKSTSPPAGKAESNQAAAVSKPAVPSQNGITQKVTTTVALPETIPANALVINGVVKSLKGEEAFMFSPSTKLPSAHFDVKVFRLHGKVQLGQWFELTCTLYENSSQHLKVYKSKPGFCEMPTEVVNGCVQLLCKVTVGSKTDAGYTYAYSPELRGVADVHNALAGAKLKDVIEVWCTPILQPRDGIQWKVARLKEDPPCKLPAEPQTIGTTKASAADKSSRDSSVSSSAKPGSSPGTTKRVVSNASKGPQEIRDYEGVVASESEKVFFVYCPKLEQEAILYKTLVASASLKEPMNLGVWIKFSAKLGPDRYQLSSFKRIPARHPTMPSLNSILIECKVMLPQDYTFKTYKGIVHSEFIPKVADIHNLIHKDYCGNVPTAVIRRGRNAVRPDVPWVIEYIYI